MRFKILTLLIILGLSSACSQLGGVPGTENKSGPGFVTRRLTGAYLNHTYSERIEITGVSGNYAWNIQQGSGDLPAGLVLIANDDTSALITGMPTALGVFSFTIEIVDTATDLVVIRHQFRIDVAEYLGFAIDPPSLLFGTAGSPFSKKFMTADRGILPYTWSLSENPDWIAMNASTGEMSGDPSYSLPAQDYVFTIVATDSRTPTPEVATLEVTFSLFACTAFTIITDAQLPDATEGKSYEAGIEAINGIQGGTYGGIFELSGGNLPDGFSIVDWHLVSGTPIYSGAGDYSFIIRGMDFVGQIAYKTFSLRVQDAAPPPLALNLGKAVPPAIVNRNYLTTPFVADGGFEPYIWSLRNAPSWLSVSDSGTLYGRPSSTDVAGSPFSFQVALSDSDPNSPTTVELAVVVQVVENWFAVVDTELPSAVANLNYRHWLTAYGGEGATTWAVVTKPGWMTVSSDGLITGRPVASDAGQATLSLTATDSTTPTALVSDASFTFSVLASAPPLRIEIPDRLETRVFQNPHFPARAVITGAASNCSWDIIFEDSSAQHDLSFYLAGNFVQYNREITLGRDNLWIPGRTMGVYPFTLRVEDANGNIAERKAVLTVLPEGGPVTIIESSVSPAAYEGEFYRAWFSLHGGDNDYVSMEATGLPPGLRFETTLIPNTNLFDFATLSGVPDLGSADTYPVSITVIDSHGVRGELVHTVIVGPPPASGTVIPMGIGNGIRVGGIAIEPSGRYLFYCESTAGGNICKVDLQNGEWDVWVPNAICRMPEDIVFHTDGTMYVASDASAFRIASGKQPPFLQSDLQRFALANGWAIECELNSAGTTLYVTSFGITAADQIDAINVTTGVVTETYFPVGFFVEGLAWRNGSIYAGSGYCQTIGAQGNATPDPSPIFRFDGGDLESTPTMIFSGLPLLTGSVEFDSPGNLIIVSPMDHKVLRLKVDPALGSVSAQSVVEELADFSAYIDPYYPSYGGRFDSDQNAIFVDSHDNLYLGTTGGILKIVKP